MVSNSIQNSIQQNQYNVQFDGKKDLADNGVPYYKSDFGIKGAAILCIPAAADFLPDIRLKNADHFEKTVNESLKEIEDGKASLDKLAGNKTFKGKFDDFLLRYKKSLPDAEGVRKIWTRRCKIAIPATIAATGCTLGCGALIDTFRNKKAEQTAKQIAFEKNNGIIPTVQNSAAESEISYHKSKTGRQLGPILGAVCGVFSAFLNGGIAKSAVNMGGRVFLFGLGGLLAGSIYDRVTNLRAKETVNVVA